MPNPGPEATTLAVAIDRRDPSPLSVLYRGKNPVWGPLLCYAGSPKEELEAAARTVARVLAD